MTESTSHKSEQYCTFYLDRHLFGIEVNAVQEVIRHQPMTQVPLAPAVVRGLINLRGQIVVAVDLRRRLEMPDLDEGRLPMNVVVRSTDGVFSLLVDEIGDVLEVRPEEFEPPLDHLTGPARDLARGTYKLKDRLLLTLDTEKALQFAP